MRSRRPLHPRRRPRPPALWFRRRQSRPQCRPLRPQPSYLPRQSRRPRLCWPRCSPTLPMLTPRRRPISSPASPSRRACRLPPSSREVRRQTRAAIEAGAPDDVFLSSSLAATALSHLGNLSSNWAIGIRHRPDGPGVLERDGLELRGGQHHHPGPDRRGPTPPPTGTTSSPP